MEVTMKFYQREAKKEAETEHCPTWQMNTNTNQRRREESETTSQWENLRNEFKRNYEVYANIENNPVNGLINDSYNQYLPETLEDENLSQVSDANSLFFLPSNQFE